MKIIFLLEIFIFTIQTTHSIVTLDIGDILNAIMQLTRNTTSPQNKARFFKESNDPMQNQLYLEGFMGRRYNAPQLSAKDQRENAEKAKAQHRQRMKEVINFMKRNHMTTVYLHTEVQRIKRTREVLDRLRRMVYELEKPGSEAMLAKVMDCYKDVRLNETHVDDVWHHRPNNWVINTIKDTFNDGVY